MPLPKAGLLLLLILGLHACQNNREKTTRAETADYAAGTFGYDLDFLRARDSVYVLKNESGKAQVLVSAKYQGKVFTSTANGREGKSFGWINYPAFEAQENRHMNAYGGENRLWLGPEGGKFSLFFQPGSAMEFENWETPPAIDTESWQVLSSDERHVSLQKETTLVNYSGTELKARIKRDIRILENAEIEKMLSVQLAGGNGQAVGFTTDNALTNTGEKAWTEASGAPCIWILDMFNPSPSTTVVVPYNQKASSKIATTDYFGEIPEDRISYREGFLLFKADGRSRGKLGLRPDRAKPLAGSYDAANNILTITTFDVDQEAIYLNQEWRMDKNPLVGDAVNAYNDGPLADGSQMGPFYEIESVSPAAFLQPGQTLTHQHNVFHFTGEKTALDQIAQSVLGISLDKIQSSFK
ncbi:hypothetical protein BH24BAC1_BH24BAC1_39740 [soil metagenome]